MKCINSSHAAGAPALSPESVDPASQGINDLLARPHARLRPRRQLPGCSPQAYASFLVREGRPPSPGTRSLLRRGNQAIDETKALLPWRSNVGADILHTRNEGALRQDAYAEVVGGPESPKEVAAQALLTGAATCEGFSVVAALKLAPTLKKGELVRQVLMRDPERSGRDDEHVYLILENGRREVVVDPWADGPAVLSEDCWYKELLPETDAEAAEADLDLLLEWRHEDCAAEVEAVHRHVREVQALYPDLRATLCRRVDEAMTQEAGLSMDADSEDWPELQVWKPDVLGDA